VAKHTATTVFNRGNCENWRITNYLLKLKVAGLDSDPYKLPKNYWSMDIGMWPGIEFPDIYV